MSLRFWNRRLMNEALLIPPKVHFSFTLPHSMMHGKVFQFVQIKKTSGLCSEGKREFTRQIRQSKVF
jgi:hypothetical protein